MRKRGPRLPSKKTESQSFFRDGEGVVELAGAERFRSTPASDVIASCFSVIFLIRPEPAGVMLSRHFLSRITPSPPPHLSRVLVSPPPSVAADTSGSCPSPSSETTR